MERERSASVVLSAGAACVALAISGCGGARQDANEPSGTFHVAVVSAKLAKKQRVSAATAMRVTVRNVDSKTIPNLTITVRTNSADPNFRSGSQNVAADGFNYVSSESGLSDPRRPVWIVDSGPASGTTTYDATWAVGPLAPGMTKTFIWKLTPVKVGTWSVGYRVDAGLNGKAVAALANGAAPTGRLTAQIGNIPPQAQVDPNTRRVIRTPPAVAPGTPPQAAGEGQ